MKFQTKYTHTRARSKTFATENTEESMTQQSDKDDCDINVIMNRYKVTGQLPQVQSEPLYADFTEVGDYRTAMDKIREANEKFHEIPAQIREKFANDPHQFADWMANKDNLDEARAMGLAPPAPKPQTPDHVNLDVEEHDDHGTRRREHRDMHVETRAHGYGREGNEPDRPDRHNPGRPGNQGTERLPERQGERPVRPGSPGQGRS